MISQHQMARIHREQREEIQRLKKLVFTLRKHIMELSPDIIEAVFAKYGDPRVKDMEIAKLRKALEDQ